MGKCTVLSVTSRPILCALLNPVYTQCTFVYRYTYYTHHSLRSADEGKTLFFFSFLDQVTLLNFMHSKSIHVFPANSKILFSFRVEKYFRYIYQTLLSISLFLGVKPGSTSLQINMEVQIPLC